MVEPTAGPIALNELFAALADPTRRGILARLAAGEASTLELAEPYDMSLPAVSKHLGVLERAGLVERRIEGRERRCRLVAAPLHQAFDWLSFYERFWHFQLDRLELLLAHTDPAKKGPGTPWPSNPPARTASPSRALSTRRRSASSRRGRRRK